MLMKYRIGLYKLLIFSSPKEKQYKMNPSFLYFSTRPSWFHLLSPGKQWTVRRRGQASEETRKHFLPIRSVEVIPAYRFRKHDPQCVWPQMELAGGGRNRAHVTFTATQGLEPLEAEFLSVHTSHSNPTWHLKCQVKRWAGKGILKNLCYIAWGLWCSQGPLSLSATVTEDLSPLIPDLSLYPVTGV